MECKHKSTKKGFQSKTFWFKFFALATGFLALLWFLIRVVPKPSRLRYPCQRVAAPIATSFLIWLFGVFGSVSAIKKAKQRFNNSRYISAALLTVISVGCIWASLSFTNEKKIYAQPHTSNVPIGDAKGIIPGHVVWVHAPNATDWMGPGYGDGYFFQPEHTNQNYVENMIAHAVTSLTGQADKIQAWDSLFRYFNLNQGKGDVGYQQGERITIKINMVTCNILIGSVNTETYKKVSYLNNTDVSPQVITALLNELVYVAHVEPNKIAIGDTTAYFPNQWWDICHSQFPEVTFFDIGGKFGRVKAQPSSSRIYWSHGLDPNQFIADYAPDLYAEADYLINLAVLKGHYSGVTFCGKNHYGSLMRLPSDTGYYNLHNSIAGEIYDPVPGHYRAKVDIMGHPDIGKKTFLYMIDGLYGGYPAISDPYKFQTAPFNDDWPSSIFVSQDPVAIDSVALDLLWEEWPSVVRISAVDDYLHEAAEANNPASGTFYDSDGDGIALDSLGVHEHWNNPIDKQYSGNLGTGNGIKLTYEKITSMVGDFDNSGCVDYNDIYSLAQSWLWTGQPGTIQEDIVADGIVNSKDFCKFAQNWQYTSY